MKPSEVCERLNCSPSTLRKYSLKFEEEGILFKRNQNNSRIYTDTQFVALQEAMTATKNGERTLEDAVREASKALKGATVITPENAVTEPPSQRHDDDATAVMLEEIRSLRKEIKERDQIFVEVLEKMQEKIDLLEERLTLPEPEEVEEQETAPDPQPMKKKGFFSRLFK